MTVNADTDLECTKALLECSAEVHVKDGGGGMHRRAAITVLYVHLSAALKEGLNARLKCVYTRYSFTTLHWKT